MSLTRITSDGITDGTITGSDLATNVDLIDNQKIRFGTGNDLEIYHDGSNSYLTNTTGELRITDTSIIRVNTDDFRIYKGNGTELTFRAEGDGACSLFHNNSKKFETTASGVDVTGNCTITGNFRGNDNVKLNLGNGDDLQIYHDGSFNFIRSENGHPINLIKSTTENIAKFIPDGAVELYHDNSLRFQTHSAGVLVSGNVYLNDNNKFIAGTSNDLEIFHDGSDSFIKDTGTGGLYIHTSQFLVRNAAGSSPNMEIQDDGRVFVPEVYNRTTGSAVNMRVDSDGELRRSTSSKRYKKDITDATWGLAELLKLKPITYKSNATGKDADDKTYGGFTAEDIHDLGLTEFVDYNEKNEPDALAYGNMVALMAKAIQDLNVEVEGLKTKVAALNAS